MEELAFDDNRKTEVVCGACSTFIHFESGATYGCGQLGVEDRTTQPSFTLLRTSASAVASVAAGEAHTLSLLDGGEVVGNGVNLAGQLGVKETYVQGQLVAEGVIQVASGSYHSAVLLEDGRLMTTGQNRSGQLGLGNYAPYYRFTPVPVEMAIASVVCGKNNTTLLLEDGSIASCGKQLADTYRFYAFSVPAPVAQVAYGDTHSVLRFDDGRIAFCAADYVAVVPTPQPVVQVAYERFHGLVLYRDGTIATCDIFNAEFTPVLTSKQVAQVACGEDHSFLRFVDGTFAARGMNHFGQLGRPICDRLYLFGPVTV